MVDKTRRYEDREEKNKS